MSPVSQGKANVDMQPAKTVAAIHDLSGLGRCALTVVIPVKSAMGLQVCPVPTAVLSAHTAFQGIALEDLTRYMHAHLSHWTSLGEQFDAIYTGYLAHPEQIDIVRDFMASQPDAMKIIDPVMGDHGKLYRALSAEMPEQMRKLCAHADYITPNLTEYALLTRAAYSQAPRSEHDILDMMRRLLDCTGAKNALLTSVPMASGLVNAYQPANGELQLLRFDLLAAHYPGTGDLFTSVFAGSLLTGSSAFSAMQRSTQHVRDTIAITMQCGTAPQYGVQLEKTLSLLINQNA